MTHASDNLNSIDLETLKAASNWQAQFRLIMQWGELIQNKPLIRNPSNIVKGCETAAWLTHRQEGNWHFFYFDSDSKIIRGLAAIVLAITDAKTTQQIQHIDLDNLLQDLGIRLHLTPSRNNGFRTIVARVKTLSGLE